MLIISLILGSSLSSYDETALVSSAFRVLRTMVAAWLREVSRFRNVFADYQIIHFYRWLRSPGALLYDPALRKTLLGLMRKLFVQLVSEFRRLGAEVVFADFNRIILNTKKRCFRDDSLVSCPSFEIVVMSILTPSDLGRSDLGPIWEGGGLLFCVTF